MMKTLQRLGKSLMLPVACLPVAGILMGIGYWIDPSGWGANNLVALILIKAGGALVDNMAILFAVGVAVGMSKDQEGTSALAGIVSWLVFQQILGSVAPSVVGNISWLDVTAFTKVNNQFIGIFAGLIGASCYNRFHKTQLPEFLSFFSGRRSVAIMTAVFTLIICIPMFFVWPLIYGALVKFGEVIMNTGAIGAGIYGFFNRLLIPVGLHHALNSVFWFDVAGINDIARFWGSMELLPTTGIYMTGFFPVMMFGLPGAALAMYLTAKTKNKKNAAGILLAAALCSFFTGVTEPLEFSFMFLAPALYAVHALLSGISLAICALLPTRAGFNFSAGFVDWILSFNAPGAQNPWLLIPIGLVFFAIYFVVFYFLIKKFDFKTPGREDDVEDELNVELGSNDFTAIAKVILEGCGGKNNIVTIDNCITRLRLEVKDRLLVDEKKIKSAGVKGVLRPSKTSVQVIVGPKVQFVADEFKKLCK